MRNIGERVLDVLVVVVVVSWGLFSSYLYLRSRSSAIEKKKKNKKKKRDNKKSNCKM